MNKHTRYFYLDFIRFTAIILMVIFHFFYDLRIHGLISFSMKTPFWFYFPRVIVFLFLISVGASLNIAYSHPLNWQKIWHRFFKLAALAALISLITYFLFPNNWIYFGTLHCIALSSLLGVFFIKRYKASLLGITLILGSYFYFDLNFSKLSSIVSIKSMDYIPIYPWFWVVLLGILLQKLHLERFFAPENKLTQLVTLISKHSLKIYLIHQPVLFGSLWLVKEFIK